MINAKTVVCSTRLRNCWGIELLTREFKTVAISVTRAKLYCINKWFACRSPTLEAESPAGNLASAYPPKPLLFEMGGPVLVLGLTSGGPALKTVAGSHAWSENCCMLEQIEKLSRYQTIDQGLQNCRNIGHLSKVIAYSHMVCMYEPYPWGRVPCRQLSIRVSSQTPSFWSRGLTWLADVFRCRIVQCGGESNHML